MKTIQQIVIGIWLMLFPVWANAQHSSAVYIQGNIWPAANDSITLTYYSHKLGHTSVNLIKETVPAKNGFFQFNIPNMSEPFFASIISGHWKNLVLNHFLIEPGDSIVIKVLDSNYDPALLKAKPFFHISGRNASKIQFQHNLEWAVRHNKIQGIKPQIANSYNDLNEILPDILQNTKLNTMYWDSLYNQQAEPISVKATAALKLDLQIKKIKALLNAYNSLFEKKLKQPDRATAVPALVEEYQKTVHPQVEEILRNNVLDILTPEFLDFAVRKTMADTRYKKGHLDPIPAMDYFQALQQWPENTREKIVASLLAYFYVYNPRVKNPSELLTHVETMVQNPELKKIIHKFQGAYIQGTILPDVSFTNTKGEKIFIRDFRDKVVVMDFWFTGCRACIAMSRILKQIKDKMGEQEDIVFVSISVDEKKDVWLQSVAQGIYTHPNFINLYTNGEGKEHPLTKRYDMSAYPRLMILGKGNKLIDASPNFPNNPDEIDELMSAIMNAR